MNTLRASRTPVHDIEKISYPGQSPKRKQYHTGFETYMNRLPNLEEPDDVPLNHKIQLTKEIMEELAGVLSQEQWVRENVAPGAFERFIISLESPKFCGTMTKKVIEGKELVVAKWGDGFTGPVHGHASGYMHEAVLNGKIRVNTYRKVSEDRAIVRPAETIIQEGGTFVSGYAEKSNSIFPRPHLVHNFTAIGPAASLHYLPEHTRDGRDNVFEVERFEDTHTLREEDLIRITAQQAIYLQKGEVVLVRSENVPEYGDHFIVITGPAVLKPHGLRPQDRAIWAPNTKTFLNQFEPKLGLIAFQLKKELRDEFLTFHAITAERKSLCQSVKNIIFPQV